MFDVVNCSVTAGSRKRPAGLKFTRAMPLLGRRTDSFQTGWNRSSGSPAYVARQTCCSGFLTPPSSTNGLL